MENAWIGLPRPKSDPYNSVAWLSPVEAARRVQKWELKGLLMRMLKESLHWIFRH